MFKTKFFNAFVIALILLQAVIPIPALAMASTTTQQDYAPGSVVTISGDGTFAAGDSVHVEVSGPNGFTDTCDVTAVENGAWSCDVSVPSDDSAAGEYSYTATGGDPEVSQSGSFTVTAPPPPTAEVTAEPTQEATQAPTATEAPTQAPTAEPTQSPTAEPTQAPTQEAIQAPTEVPTQAASPTATVALTPFITSDKADYAPSELVTLTSGNWQPGEWVVVFVNDNIGQTWSVTTNKQADTSGAFTYQFNLPDRFVATYQVTATGEFSGRATTDFTDSVNVSLTAPASFVWHRTGEVAGGFNITGAQGTYTCNNTSGGAVSACTAVTNVTITDSGAAGSKAITGLAANVTNAAWGPVTLEFRTLPGSGQFAIPASDGKYNVTATLNTNAPNSPSTDTKNNYFGVDNTNPVTTLQCDANNPCSSNPYNASTTVSVKLKGDDGAAAVSSGIASTVYCVDTTNTCTPATPYTSSGFSVAYVAGATYYVRYFSTDIAGNVETTKSQTIVFTAVNTAPTVTAPSNQSANEGASTSFSLGSFSDPNGGPWSVDVDWDDASSHTTFSMAADGTITAQSHTYADGPNTFTVTVKVTDSTSLFNSKTFQVTVNNVAPTVTLSGPTSANEGDTKSYSYTTSDPGTETFSLVNASCGANGTLSNAAFNAATGAGSFDCTFPDGPANSSVSVQVADSDGANSNTDTKAVTIANVAPTASLSNNGPISEGGSATITFSGGTDASSVDALSLHYAFDCNGGSLASATYAGSGTSTSTSCTFNDDGSYTVSGKVMDKDGGSNEYTTSVGVNNVVPTATFEAASPINEGSNSALSFTGASDPSNADTIAGFHYSFACDGLDASLATTYAATGTASTTNCAFDDNGAYTVKGRVFDKNDGYTTYQATVIVNNVAPIATLGNDGPVDEGSPATVSFSGQFDPSSADTAAGFTYSYDFDNDGTFEITGSASASAIVPASYLDDGPGTRIVKARIADKDGGFNDYTTTITINNVAPTATFGNTGPVDEGTAFSLSLTSPLDPSNADTTAGFTYAFDCGDGSGYGSFGASATANCPTTDNGTRSVKGKIQDKDGGITEYTASVTVNNVAPTATLGNDGPVDEGSPATVSFSGQFDPSSADTTAGFHYALSCTNGDLSAATYAGSGTSASTNCTFADNGTYTVKGRIFDKDGSFTEYTTDVTVNNVAPMVNAGSDATINEGSTFSGSGSFTDPGADTWTATVDYGDGGGVQALSLSGKDFSLSHVYADNGSYTVTVCVTDDDSGSNCDDLTVTVKNVEPTMVISGAASVNEGSSYSLTLGLVTDPGTDTVSSYIVHWGDGFSDTYSSNGAKTHTYGDGPNSYNITVDLVDEDGTFLDQANALSVTVDNVAPTVTALFASSSVSCGASNGALNVSFSDPGIDTHTATIDWGDGSGVQSLGTVTSPFSASHTYATAGTYNATVTVTDSDGAPGSDSVNAVTVNFTIVGGGILQPINPGPPLSIFKYGSTIPVKIKVQDCDGSYPSSLAPQIKVVKISGSTPITGADEASSTSAADSGTTMRFTGSPDYQYIYNLATKPLSDPTATYQITITILATGQTVTATFGLKSK